MDYDPTLFELILLGLVLVAGILVLVYAGIAGAPPMSSRVDSRVIMGRQLPPDIAGPIYELGAGWGAVTFHLARMFPQCRIVAWEMSPIPWLFCRLRLLVSRRRNVEIHRGDFFKVDLAPAEAVFCYLFPRHMRRLAEKFDAELRPGTWIVSNTFHLPGWEPILHDRSADVLVYRKSR